MPRVTLDLNTDAGRQLVKGVWRFGSGYIPGEPNQGLVAEVKASDARLKDFDDSSWPECTDIRTSISTGFTFGWYRIHVEIPAQAHGIDLAGTRVWFETNVDNYGELWIDGVIDPAAGVIVGNNVARRVEVVTSAVPGDKYTIACLVANGPLAEPRGSIFMRFAYLAFESPN